MISKSQSKRQKEKMLKTCSLNTIENALEAWDAFLCLLRFLSILCSYHQNALGNKGSSDF